MLEAALRYQTQGDDWVKRVLIGGVVVFLGLFFIPIFTLNGYLVEVMRRAMRGNLDSPPEWGELDLVDATVEGLLVGIIGLGYTFVVVILASIPFVALLGVGVASGTEALSIVGVGIGVLIFFGLLLVLAVVFPVAIANYVRTDTLAGGFDAQTIKRIGTNSEMLMAIVLGVAVSFIAGGINSILGFTIVGYVFVPFIGFATQSATFYLWGRGFADAYEEEHGEPPLEPDHDSVAGGAVGHSPGANGPMTDETGWDDDRAADAGTGWDDDDPATRDDDTDSGGWNT